MTPPRRYRARLAATPEDLAAAQRLRHLAFLAGPGATASGDAWRAAPGREGSEGLCLSDPARVRGHDGAAGAAFAGELNGSFPHAPAHRDLSSPTGPASGSGPPPATRNRTGAESGRAFPQAPAHRRPQNAPARLPAEPPRDADAFDAICRHVLVEETGTGALVATCRVLPLASGAALGQSYSAQYYDLAALSAYPGPMMEMGRFCLRPGHRDPDILRLAWAQVVRLVDEGRVEMLFGCSSFRGTDAAAYPDAFAELARRHLAPRRWRPRVKAADVFRFARLLRRREPDARQALLTMPPLLRSYLAMGGWVSDHAVVDRDMDTLHVFTGLEVGRIPPARVRLMRALAV